MWINKTTTFLAVKLNLKLGHKSAARSCVRRAGTLAALPPFSSTVAALLYWKCAITWEKLTSRYFLTLLTFGCGASKTLGSGRKGRCCAFAASCDSVCIRLRSNPPFASRLAFFLSLFLSFTVHNSLLPYTAIFQHSTAQERRVRGN